MNKILLLGLVLLSIITFAQNAQADIVRYPDGREVLIQSFTNDTNPYDADLTRIENCIFGKSYRKDNNAVRLNRIEQKLFSKSYPTMDISKRMNNVIANYQRCCDRALTSSNYSNYYNSRRNSFNNYYNPNSIKSRMYNNFIGRPTGFTPSIVGSPFLNGSGPAYTNSYSGTRGWGYQNSFNPTMTGAGIHILN